MKSDRSINFKHKKRPPGADSLSGLFLLKNIFDLVQEKRNRNYYKTIQKDKLFNNSKHS